MLNHLKCEPNNSRGRIFQENLATFYDTFQSDKDRILKSSSFRRLQYKTQVFLNNEGDHFRNRLTHSLEVAQIARETCLKLGLNEDLAEALSLAHDIGHSPFGHAGEDALNLVMEEYGGFDHNSQTLKTLTEIEKQYINITGLNLCFETLEGIVKHNGPLTGPYSSPKKEVGKFILDFSKKFDLNLDKFASLEAQVASLSDDIAYNNHDIEDGFRAGFIKIEDLLNIVFFKNIIEEIYNQYPQVSHEELILEALRRSKSLMIEDLINTTISNATKLKLQNSHDVRDCDINIAAFSEKMQSSNTQISLMLRTKVYSNYKVNRMTNKSRRVIIKLFNIYIADPGCLPNRWQHKINNCVSKNEIAAVICDYISGMTDRYAIKEYISFFDPSLDQGEL
jgi:dGTPase